MQHPFRKFWIFNGLALGTIVLLAYLAISSMPVIPARPVAQIMLSYRPVALPAGQGPLRVAGAWEMRAPDRRLGGVSALAIEGDQLLAISDRGSAMRFSRPFVSRPTIWFADLREGPGRWGGKWSRDAESLAPDPRGRGWWVGYEQTHSIVLYDAGFGRALETISLRRPTWYDNRGAEGMIAEAYHLLVTAENGRDALRVAGGVIAELPLAAGADVAEAAAAPDGSAWLLLRSKDLGGIRQSIAPLIRTASGYRAGPAWPVPKGAFDNYEGMAVEARRGGGLRFWLISDDGHRLMARTLLVALDYDPSGHDKSPAQDAGLSKKPNPEAG